MPNLHLAFCRAVDLGGLAVGLAKVGAALSKNGASGREAANVFDRSVAPG